ncbi:MAG: aminoglycoside phosphotransferase family protein, partial [Isosphaeraceae bacterium]
MRLSRTSQWGLSSHEQLAREFATLRDVESSGVTPCALDLVPGDPPMLIETYIDGQPFLYGLRLRDAARAIAAVHRSLPRHALPHLPMAPPQRFLVEDGLRWVARAEAQGFTPVTVRLLLRAAESLCEATAMSADPLVIVHTDLIGTNLLVTDTGCAILDWEGARLGPAAWDLAYFLSPVTLRWASAGAGQLSVGEKQAFAICDDARIETTKGTVVFDKPNRRRIEKPRRKVGSKVTVHVKMSRAEFQEMKEAVKSYLPQADIEFRVDGVPIPYRKPWKIIEGTLTTEIEDSGAFKRTARKTKIHILKAGAKARLYEMGIPITEIESKYDI